MSANVDNPDVFDFLRNTGDTTQSITVPPGYYWVRATDTSGCSIESDSLVVYSQPLPEVELIDSSHYCENSSLVISPTVSDGTPPYNYEWLGYGNDLELEVNQEETYTLVVFDNFTVKVQSDEISSDEYTFNLLDSRGRVLRKIVFDGIVQVNRENLAKGVYIIQISSERVSHQQKIIFE